MLQDKRADKTTTNKGRRKKEKGEGWGQSLDICLLHLTKGGSVTLQQDSKSMDMYQHEKKKALGRSCLFFPNSVQHIPIFGGWTWTAWWLLSVRLLSGMWASQQTFVSNITYTTATRISCQMSLPTACNNSLQQLTDLLQKWCELTKGTPNQLLLLYCAYTTTVSALYTCIYILICTHTQNEWSMELQCVA